MVTMAGAKTKFGINAAITVVMDNGGPKRITAAQ